PYALIIDVLDQGGPGQSEGHPPVTAVDILGGHVVLPPSVAESATASGFGEGLALPHIAGVTVLTEAQEMLAVHASASAESEQRSKFVFQRAEDFRQVLQDAGFSDLDSVYDRPVGDF